MGNIFYTCIDQGNIGVLESCGEYRGELQPGCHCLIPFVHSVAYNFNMRQMQLLVNVDTATRDNVFCKVIVAVFYHAKRNQIMNLAYNVADIKGIISSLVQNEVRTSLKKLSLDEALLQKEELSNPIKEKLIQELDKHGLNFVGVVINDIEPDSQVRRAMNEINTQQRLKQAAYEQAEGEKIKLIKNAEAQAEAKKLSGIGIAEQRRAIVEGLGNSVSSFMSAIPDTNAERVMQLVMMNQYFDTLKELGHNSKSNCIFVPHTPNSITELDNKLFASSVVNKQD